MIGDSRDNFSQSVTNGICKEANRWLIEVTLMAAKFPRKILTKYEYNNNN